jgi:putative membrane protein
MKTFLKTIIFSSAVIIACSSCKKDDDDMDTLNTRDISFISNAAMASNAEVQFAQLALSKSSNDSVRNYALMMINDHSMGLQSLDSIAGRYNLQVNTGIDSLHQVLKLQLDGMNGYQFDTAYSHGHVKDHIAAINLYQEEANNGVKQDLRDFANRTLPELNEHLLMANAVSTTLH